MYCIYGISDFTLYNTKCWQKEQANKFIPVTKTLTVYTTIPVEMASIIASEYQKMLIFKLILFL